MGAVIVEEGADLDVKVLAYERVPVKFESVVYAEALA